MRASFLILAVAFALQGCTALGAGFAADLNRQRRADARVDLAADSLLSPGDPLVLYVADGREIREAFVSVQSDSVHLDACTVALADVERAERPWRRTSVSQGAVIGAGLDAVLFGLFFYSLSNLSIPLDITL